MPLERNFQRSALTAIRDCGFYAIKLHGTAFSRAGLPDVLALKNGRVVCFELKQPGEEPTPIQRIIRRRLARYGVPVHVASSVADVRRHLEAFDAH